MDKILEVKQMFEKAGCQMDNNSMYLWEKDIYGMLSKGEAGIFNITIMDKDTLFSKVAYGTPGAWNDLKKYFDMDKRKQHFIIYTC